MGEKYLYPPGEYCRWKEKTFVLSYIFLYFNNIFQIRQNYILAQNISTCCGSCDFLPLSDLSCCKVVAVESLAQSCSCSSCILGGFVTEPMTRVMSHCVVEAGVADVSDTHSMVPRARCQSLGPCGLAGCSAREALEVRGVEGKAQGRQGYELQWPSGKFSPASK